MSHFESASFKFILNVNQNVIIIYDYEIIKLNARHPSFHSRTPTHLPKCVNGGIWAIFNYVLMSICIWHNTLKLKQRLKCHFRKPFNKQYWYIILQLIYAIDNDTCIVHCVEHTHTTFSQTFVIFVNISIHLYISCVCICFRLCGINKGLLIVSISFVGICSPSFDPYSHHTHTLTRTTSSLHKREHYFKYTHV